MFWRSEFTKIMEADKVILEMFTFDCTTSDWLITHLIGEVQKKFFQAHLIKTRAPVNPYIHEHVVNTHQL
jgi:phage terminase large subunit-like protein